MTAFFYDLCYMLPLGMAFILSALGLGLGDQVLVSVADGSPMSPVAGCVICSMFVIIILALRYLGKKERALLGGILVVSLASFWGILGQAKREILFDKYSWVLAVLVISLMAILVGRITEELIWAKLLVSVLLLTGIIYMMVNRMSCPKGTLGCCVSVVLIYLLEVVQRNWNKSGYTDVKNHVARIAPVIMMMAIIVICIPAPSEKFEWRMAKDFWKVAVTEYKRLVGSITMEKEEYAYTGFSEDAGVKAGISDSGREVMLVTSDKRSFNRLYMGGITYEEFDGKKWSTKLDSELGDREFDFIEARAAISKFAPGYEYDYLKVDNIKVENRLLNTKYVFAPMKANLYSSKTTIPNHKETKTKIHSDRKMKYGNSYQIDYIQLNYDNPDLILAVDTAQPIDENEWEDVLRKNSLAKVAGMSFENYLAYQDDIYSIYGGDKELTIEDALEEADLSDEVKGIVRDVIGNDKIGDFEKLKAVSDYLQTMDYTKKTDALPKDIHDAASYLDYFLLESQSGYCVHYATAFTLLARQLGYPARYVQGYYVERSKGTDIVVTEKRAHAWAEVYFDHFGWLIFEATPGYSLSRGWAVSGTTGDTTGVRPHLSVTNEPAEDASMEELILEEETSYGFLLYIAIPLFCALLFGMLYLLISRVVAKKKYRKMNEEDKARTMISKNMRILKTLGYPLGERVTLEEFKKEIAEDKELAEHMGFIKLYERLLYSDHKVCATDVENVEREYELLKGIFKAKRKVYYIWGQYLM